MIIPPSLKNIPLMLCLLSLISCSYRSEKEGEGQNLKSGGGRFAVISETILKPKCASCHSGTNASDRIDVSTYEAIISSNIIVPGKSGESKLYTSVLTGRMPRGRDKLSSAEVKLIEEWIDAGAGETDPQVAPPSPTPKPTYEWISKNIIESRCVLCHNTLKPRGKVDLSSYEALIASTGKEKRPIVPGQAEKSTFFLELLEQKMPPDIKKLTNEETAALRLWIEQGAVGGPIPPNPGPVPTPNPPEPNYVWLQRNVFGRKCGSCHGIPQTIAKVDFTTYNTLLGSLGKKLKPLVPHSPEQSGIYTEIVSGSMPPARKANSAVEIEAVRQWINNGAQKN